MKKIAGCVILYNPELSVIDNIKTYLPYIDVLYVVLNSDISGEIHEYLDGEENITTINHYENEGIARSLNEVLNLVKANYNWLLTMDQDSMFVSSSIEKYLHVVEKVDIDEVYGVTSVITDNKIIKYAKEYDYIDRCITSGMILNVKIAYRYGGFCEDLFIDEVDYEFCYRLNKEGFKLIRYPHKIMQHYIGNEKIYSLFGFKFSSENEKYFRLYYIYRNCLYVMNEYKDIRGKYILTLLKRTIKIILAEDDKVRKIKYALKGVKAYFTHETGKMKK